MDDTRQLPLFATVGQVSLSRSTSLAQAIDPFQRYLRSEGKTDNTIKGFTSDLHLMCQFFGNDVSISKLSTKDLNRFLDWLENGRGQPCSRKSYARRVTTIKVFFKWLKHESIRVDNPAKAVIQRSGPAPLQPILPQHEVHLLLDYTHQLRTAPKPDARPDLLVRLLLDTGIKKSECMNLSLDSIEVDDPQHPMLNIQHKGRQNLYKERRLPLDAGWLDILGEFRVQYKITDTIFECTARNLEYVLHDTAVAAGVDGKVSFEILRWTSAVRSYLNGMDMEDLREKMGLSRISWRETSQKIITLSQRYTTR